MLYTTQHIIRAYTALYLGGTLSQRTGTSPPSFLLLDNHLHISKLSPASEASREVANLTWWKNPHPPVYGVKGFVCLFVCYEFWPKLSQDWQNRMGCKLAIIFLSCASPQNCFSKNFSFIPLEFKNGNHFKKKFASLAAAAVLVSPFLHQKQPFLELLSGNNYLDSHHSQGVWNLPHKFDLYLIVNKIQYSLLGKNWIRIKATRLVSDQFQSVQSCEHQSGIHMVENSPLV